MIAGLCFAAGSGSAPVRFSCFREIAPPRRGWMEIGEMIYTAAYTKGGAHGPHREDLHERPQPGRSTPRRIRFEGDEVLIRRDEKTGDVILSERDARKANWERFLELRKQVTVPDDFLSPEERNSLPETDRDPFEGWEE